MVVVDLHNRFTYQEKPSIFYFIPNKDQVIQVLLPRSTERVSGDPFPPHVDVDVFESGVHKISFVGVTLSSQISIIVAKVVTEKTGVVSIRHCRGGWSPPSLYSINIMERICPFGVGRCVPTTSVS